LSPEAIDRSLQWKKFRLEILHRDDYKVPDPPVARGSWL